MHSMYVLYVLAKLSPRIMASCGTRIQLLQTQLHITLCNGTHYWNY